MEKKSQKTNSNWPVVIGLIVAGIITANAISIANSGPAPVTATPTVQQVQQRVAPPTSTILPTSTEINKIETSRVSEIEQTSNLSNDNYYTNVDGNKVHAPAYSDTSCEAVGASAQCRDGTCSFSQNRRGTCSHHGGVARWLY